MIGGLIRLALVGAGAAYVADRILARRAEEAPREPIVSEVEIDAPADAVWAVVADVTGQPRWMTDLKAVEALSSGPIGVGSRYRGRVRILGITVDDPVEITEFDPPRRFAIRHDGRFTGSGIIDLEPVGDGSRTRVTWNETLVPPVLPHLGAAIGAPILSAVFQADLDRLKVLVEDGEAALAALTGSATEG